MKSAIPTAGEIRAFSQRPWALDFGLWEGRGWRCPKPKAQSPMPARDTARGWDFSRACYTWRMSGGRWKFPPTTYYLPPTTYCWPPIPSGSTAAHSVRYVVYNRSTVAECITVLARKSSVLARKFVVLARKLVVSDQKVALLDQKVGTFRQKSTSSRFSYYPPPLRTSPPTESSHFRSKKSPVFDRNPPVFGDFARLLTSYINAREKKVSPPPRRQSLPRKPTAFTSSPPHLFTVKPRPNSPPMLS